MCVMHFGAIGRRFIPRLSMIALILAVIAVIASPGAATADEVTRFPFEMPPDLMRQIRDGPVDLSYALVGFPDGGAAIQVSASIQDPGPFDLFILDDSIIVYLDRRGNVTGQVAVPKLSFDGARAVLGLADGHILLMRAGRGYVFLAEIDPDGAVVWQRNFESGTYGALPPPVRLPSGGYVLLEDSVAKSRMRRLDVDGRQLWERIIPYPIAQTEQTSVQPIAIAAAANGDIIVICSFGNDEFDRADGWMFRFDDQGNVIWRRALKGYAGHVVALSEGSMAVFGYPHRVPDNRYRPYASDVIYWALTEFDMDDGAAIKPDWGMISNGWVSPWSCCFIQGAVALPDGGMVLVTGQSRGDSNQEDLSVVQLNSRFEIRRQWPLGDPSADGGQSGWFGGMALLGSGELLVAVSHEYEELGKATTAFYTLSIEQKTRYPPHRKRDRR